MIDLSDPDAERATLAAIFEEGRILGPEQAVRTLGELALKPEDFTESLNRAFFVSMDGTLRSGRALVDSSFPATLKGFQAIMLAQDSVSRAQLKTLAARLRELAAYRQVSAAAKRLLDAAQSGNVQVPALFQRFEAEARGLDLRGTNWRTLTQALDVARGRIDKIQDGGPSGALLTGYRALDNLLGGFPPTLCVVVGLPGQAKSGLMASVLRNAARRRERVAAFFPEDRGEWLAYRVLAHESGLAQFALRNSKLPEGDWNAYGRADMEIRNWSDFVEIDDRRGIPPADLLVASRQAFRDEGAVAVVVDNMTSVPFESERRMDLEIKNFLEEARAQADEFQRPFIVLAHAKRRDTLKPGDLPLLTDCAESSGYEKVARFALSVSLGDDGVEIGVLKSTNAKGRNAKFVMPFRGRSAMLEDDKPELFGGGLL